MENKTTASALLAIYGNPPERGAAGEPIGSGWGRNFGFGENMLFEACNTVTTGVCARKVGTNLDLQVGGVLFEAGDTYLGGTLMSNKTPPIEWKKLKHPAPLSFAIQFVDFQDSVAGGAAMPAYADTFDRPWIMEMCGEELIETRACVLDPRGEGVVGSHLVEIQDVSFNVGPGIVVQGTAWGVWTNGTKTTPPCIELTKPPAGFALDTLYETQGSDIGGAAEAFSGKACLISANNDYYGTHEDEIVLK